ncbi:MAG: CDP-alcohol phosphatidyltransferase family protein [Peptococcaceae bacterium]|nr:CDP-alcohol phosphatidyltransferase family protein [Peptococcaceae bacterium]
MSFARKERLREIDAVTGYGRSYYLCKVYAVPAREITLAARRLNLHPNHLTLISLALGLAASGFFLKGERWDLFAGGMLAYLSYVFDYSDGQLARWTGRVSPLGGWLDQVADRIKEFAVIGGLAWGDFRHSQEPAVLSMGFIALFFLFMLEYYDQMARKIPAPAAGGGNAAQAAGRRPIVPDFTIDEQYAAYTAFALAGQPRLLLGTVIALAGFLLLYRPLKGWRRYYRSLH